MPLSSSVLSSRDEPTRVVRFVSSSSSTVDGLPPRLPTLSGSPESLIVPITAVQVPGYEIIRELGRGGMGVVYLARHRRLDRYVALKMVLARQYAGPADQERFRQEVEAVARLNHPNIAQVYEVGEHDGFAFAAFEYVDGGTLLQWQREEPLPPTDAARLLATIARAVQHAHDHGIIHRDLKPANILLQWSGVGGQWTGEEKAKSSVRGSALSSDHRSLTTAPKITDFGLAKRLDGHSDLTATGMACGTPNYMAPEQIRGKQAYIGPTTDVYGLGAILYELLTAKAPFRGDTPMNTMQAVLQDPAPPVRRLRPDTPHDLDVIVAKCLEKDPTRRYASAAALADDLDRFLDNRAILARGIGPVERSRRWIARNPLTAGLIASLCVGFAVTLGFALVLWQTAANERQARIDVQQANDEAERQRAQAVAALATAETRQKDAENSHAVAVEQSKIARSNAQQAENLLAITADSIDTVLVQFAVDPRFHDADYLRVRRKLLQDAMTFYRKIEQQKGNTTFVVHRFARACYLYGVLSRTLGETDHGNEHIAQAISLFEMIFRDHKYEPRWRVEYARMCLDQLDRAETDGSTYRMNVPFYLQCARQACDDAMTSLDIAGQRECRFVLAKWKVLCAMEAGRTKPEDEVRLGLEALPEVAAMLVAQGQNKTPDVVDLYGSLLLQLAKASARCGEEQAAYFFDDADEHYRRAVEEWFPSNRTTNWHCKYALSRQLHGMYFDSIGLKNLCDQAFANTRRILETAVIASPDVTPYCVEIAQAYLEIIRFIHRHYPNEDPRPMVTLLDTSLAPYWNLGVPSDRARQVLAESKMFLAKWCEDRHHHVEAGNVYSAGCRVWMHGFKEGEGGFYLGKAQLCLGRSAFQYALGNTRVHSIHTIGLIETHDDITGGTWYNIARAWSTLSQSESPDAEADLAKALKALKNADRDGFFQVPETIRHFRDAKELDPVRGRFEPKNLATNALPK